MVSFITLLLFSIINIKIINNIIEGGLEAMSSIIETWSKYIGCSASELVTKTHQKYGPWDRVYREYQNRIITDEVILKYHYIVQ